MVGHAAVFNEWADIGGVYDERIAETAFDNIQDDDVRALFNHDENYVLGRNTAGTLRMSVDERGLLVDIDPPETQWARDLAVSMERGDITQMSFSFYVTDEKWDDSGERLKRTITSVELLDVSVVTYPAYKGTDVAMRTAEKIQEKKMAAIRAAKAKRRLRLYEVERKSIR